MSGINSTGGMVLYIPYTLSNQQPAAYNAYEFNNSNYGYITSFASLWSSGLVLNNCTGVYYLPHPSIILAELQVYTSSNATLSYNFPYSLITGASNGQAYLGFSAPPPVGPPPHTSVSGASGTTGFGLGGNSGLVTINLVPGTYNPSVRLNSNATGSIYISI